MTNLNLFFFLKKETEILLQKWGESSVNTGDQIVHLLWVTMDSGMVKI